MVDSVKRRLRDGAVENEQPPAILLRDNVTTTGGGVLKHLLLSVCDNVSRGLSQAKGVVVVALSEPPESYIDILRQAQLTDPKDSGFPSWFRLLDCYTDPLGWDGESTGTDSHRSCVVCSNVRNVDGLATAILELGKASVQSSSSDCFTIFIDSVSLLLRYHDMKTVMLLLQAFRNTEQVAALCWLMHADLHDARTSKGFEYISSTTIAVQPYVDIDGERAEGGLVTIRQKRRNGRVRENVERFFHIPGGGLSFESKEKIERLESGGGNVTAPKVQFNLSLSERELEDRSKVILPFEHQGNGQEGKIYDGRANIKMSYLASQARDLALSDAADGKEGRAPGGREDLKSSNLLPKSGEVAPADDISESTEMGTGFGEIHYLRDSDDERPDSDEDPDDDLDI
ncbi:unnamed protein product [Calypogeia fissa]